MLIVLKIKLQHKKINEEEEEEMIIVKNIYNH